MSNEVEKRRVAEVGARLVGDGMLVGLGSGSTVLALVDWLGALRPRARFVASSPEVGVRAIEVGLTVCGFDDGETADILDLAIDGADALAEDGWVLKGRGGAQTREAIVAAAAQTRVLLLSSDKVVRRLPGRVPVELHRFGLSSTLRLLGDVRLRDAPPTPDGGVLADVALSLEDPLSTQRWLEGIPGVVSHGLFAPGSWDTALIARGTEVTRRSLEGPLSQVLEVPADLKEG
ncbi:MAG TPA: ribose-5-phosphate isomerase A [Myxococcaceae bacterium]|nr:ribose-5-phosphate isomerase A [Myxococcaceae bacterium]